MIAKIMSETAGWALAHHLLFFTLVFHKVTIYAVVYSLLMSGRNLFINGDHFPAQAIFNDRAGEEMFAPGVERGSQKSTFRVENGDASRTLHYD